jgi:hypothetical protein
VKVSVKVKVGQTLVSTVDGTSVVVIRAPQDEIVLTCGGAPMTDKSTAPAEPAPLDTAHAGTTLVGKRYVDDELGLELLCTKGGQWALAVGGRALGLMAAKALPATD